MPKQTNAKAVAAFQGPSSPLGAIVDELGQLMAEVGPKNRRIEVLKAELKKWHGPGRVLGKAYEANIVDQYFEYIDAERVRQLCHPNTVRAVTMPSSRTLVTVQAVTGKPEGKQ
jgi:hypothetical protein